MYRDRTTGAGEEEVYVSPLEERKSCGLCTKWIHEIMWSVRPPKSVSQSTSVSDRTSGTRRDAMVSCFGSLYLSSAMKVVQNGSMILMLLPSFLVLFLTYNYRGEQNRLRLSAHTRCFCALTYGRFILAQPLRSLTEFIITVPTRQHDSYAVKCHQSFSIPACGDTLSEGKCGALCNCAAGSIDCENN